MSPPRGPGQRPMPQASPDRGPGSHRQRVVLPSKHIWLPCVGRGRTGGAPVLCVSAWLCQRLNVNQGSPGPPQAGEWPGAPPPDSARSKRAGLGLTTPDTCHRGPGPAPSLRALLMAGPAHRLATWELSPGGSVPRALVPISRRPLNQGCDCREHASLSPQDGCLSGGHWTRRQDPRSGTGVCWTPALQVTFPLLRAQRGVPVYSPQGPCPSPARKRYLPSAIISPARGGDCPGPFILSVSTVTPAGRKFARVSDSVQRKQEAGGREAGQHRPAPPRGRQPRPGKRVRKGQVRPGRPGRAFLTERRRESPGPQLWSKHCSGHRPPVS